MQPCDPEPDGPPEPVFAGPLLMKPAGAPGDPVHRNGDGRQEGWTSGRAWGEDGVR